MGTSPLPWQAAEARPPRGPPDQRVWPIPNRLQGLPCSGTGLNLCAKRKPSLESTGRNQVTVLESGTSGHPLGATPCRSHLGTFPLALASQFSEYFHPVLPLTQGRNQDGRGEVTGSRSHGELLGLDAFTAPSRELRSLCPLLCGTESSCSRYPDPTQPSPAQPREACGSGTTQMAPNQVPWIQKSEQSPCQQGQEKRERGAERDRRQEVSEGTADKDRDLPTEGPGS